MNNEYHTSEKESNKLDPQTVFKTTNAEILESKKTQCSMDKHRFIKLSENEIHCTLCQSTYVINPKDMQKYGF